MKQHLIKNTKILHASAVYTRSRHCDVRLCMLLVGCRKSSAFPYSYMRVLTYLPHPSGCIILDRWTKVDCDLSVLCEKEGRTKRSH